MTPPTILGLDVSPRVVDTSLGPQQIVVRARLADDLSGVNSTGRGILPDTRVRALHESGTADTGFDTINLVSGTPLDGEWERTITLPQSSRSGRWDMEFKLADVNRK